MIMTDFEDRELTVEPCGLPFGEPDMAIPVPVTTNTAEMGPLDIGHKESVYSIVDDGAFDEASPTPDRHTVYFDYAAAGHQCAGGGADFDMEVPISGDDIIRAGGLGARDDLDSFLPSAVDATDVEQSLVDALDYEDSGDGKPFPVSRPGLGAVIDVPGDIRVPCGATHPAAA